MMALVPWAMVEVMVKSPPLFDGLVSVNNLKAAKTGKLR